MTTRTQLLETRVQPWHGAPTLFINGKPDTGLMLYHNTVERGHDEMADFGAAGIDLITTGVGGAGCVREDGTLNTEPIDAAMGHILKANPRALVLTRLGLHPPAWWIQQHPGDMMVHYDPHLDQNVNAEWTSPAFSSEAWRRDMGAAMQKVIAYCEERYHEHFLGYHICSGDCGEWSYAWRHYTQSDYSPAQRAAFRKWTGDPAAEIPRDWRKGAGDDGFIKDRRLSDYMRFHSEVVADAICLFARLAKEELARRKREKIVAVFYGYHFTPPGNPSAFFNSGHHALAKVLASPDVDVLCAPYSYFMREAGGTYYSQLVAGSVRLHGKLVYSEEDTVTHVVPAHPYRYHCPDRWTTENVLRRNILGSLRDGGTSWYMDWFGANWYRDESLMGSIAATQKLAQQRLEFDNASVAQIAVVVDEDIVTRLQHDAELINRWTLERVTDLWRIGAPLDVFLKSDLERVDRKQYRLIVELEQDSARNVEDWRHQARAAGVHLYSEAGDQVMAEKQLLVIHAASDGPRMIRLPRPCTVRDAFTGALLGVNTDSIEVISRTGQTVVWKLE